VEVLVDAAARKAVQTLDDPSTPTFTSILSASNGVRFDYHVRL